MKKRSKRWFIISLILLALSAVLWFLLLEYAFMAEVTGIAAVITSTLCICFAFVGLSGMISARYLPCRVIAIVSGVLYAIVIFYGIYDMKTSTGFMAGIFGVVLHMYVSPVLLAILLVDLIVWAVVSKKRNGNVSEMKESRS